MKHILIVAYGFYPSNNMSAHRNYLRAKGLDESGYRVSIITRPWRNGQQIADSQDRSPTQITSERLFSNTTVFRVPFGDAADSRLGLLQRGLSRAPGKIGRNLAFFLCPLDVKTRLCVDPDELEPLLGSRPDVVFASADPWSNFELGKRLATHFGARYVAEYRDVWNFVDDRLGVVGFNTYNRNLVGRLKRRAMLRREVALNHDADLIVSVSPPLVENALRLTGAKNGLVLPNGFDAAEIAAAPRENYKRFTIGYIGTIYRNQQPEVFFKALETYIDRNAIPLNEISVKMIGTRQSHGFEAAMKGISACRHHKEILDLTDRLEKKESLTAQKSAAMLVIFPHKDSTGIYTGKIFEYIASGTPVLLAPSDHDVIAELLKETRTGRACDTVEECVAFIEAAHKKWKSGDRSPVDADAAAVARYSYQALNQKLIERLETLEAHRA